MRMRASSVLSASALRLGALVLLSFLSLRALADDTDPSGRVARLSFLQGAVSLEPAGAQDWLAAELNRPVTTNDHLWSDAPGSRAELDIGGAVIRVGADTGFAFLDLDDNVAQMQVTAGTVSVTVRELLENQTYEIDTPNVAVLLDQAGHYRVDVNEAGNTTVVRVSGGQAEANGGGQTIPIPDQQVTTFVGNQVISASLGAPDGFDDWTFERDREYEEAASRQYVPEDMAGTEDLDDNGQWENTPDNGYVWIPTAVAAGWAPYSFGHWAFISPWGWTWVDNASWGFAPFHYGRWTRWRNSWCWVPGPRQSRARYSPAMVGWVGGGAGAGVGPGGAAGVGWFPLGPREVYAPGHPLNHYANSAVPGAVTTVPRTVFASAQPVNAHRLNVPIGQGARFAETGKPPSIAPIRQSVLSGASGGGARRPPQALLNRVVLVRSAPPLTAGVRVRVVGPAAQSRPVAPMPSPPAPGDTRSWAERARALEHSTLPPAQSRENPGQARENPTQYRGGPGQTREYNDEVNRLQQQDALQERSQGRPNEVYRPSSGGVAPPRDDRPPGVSQSGQVEQERAPVNSYGRPQGEGRAPPGAVGQQSPGTRFVPPPPPAPVSTFQVPPPPPAPVPTPRLPPPPPAPVPTQQVPTPPPHSAPRAPARVDSPR
jgi:hypothetical protein